MTEPISNDELERIRAVAVAGQKIEAIKLYRAATGAGLAEAKQAVEALEAGRTIDKASKAAPSNDAADQIEAAVFAGKKIQAIRLYRQSSGQGLKESKDFIEALEVELRRTEPMRFTAPAAKGCGLTVLLCLFALAAMLIAAIG
jgi:ribosomal protein L7/L12